jgi:hypothetical protein
MFFLWLSIQLTDGGPSVAPELPTDVAGPPFGAAPGSPFIGSQGTFILAAR